MFILILFLQGKEELVGPPVLVCLPDKKWHPDPSELDCALACNSFLVGDEYCDCKYNNKHCRYDAGACCKSTAQGGRVKMIFEDEKCQCIDPNANENQKKPALTEEFTFAAGSGVSVKQEYPDDEGGDDDSAA